MSTNRMNRLWKSFVLESNKYSLQCIFQDSYLDLYRYGLRMVQSPEDVKDAIQDLFVNLWSYKNSLSEEVKVKPYLLVSLKHQLTRMKARPGFDLLTEDHERLLRSQELCEIPDPGLKALVSRKLDDLPARQKEILYLKYFEALSYEEIAQILDIQYQSVVNQAFRAVSKLRQDKQLSKLAMLRMNLS